MTGAALAALAVPAVLLLGAGYLVGRRTARPLRPSDVGTPVEHATFETLHTASLAAPPLRAGLTEESARRAARRLRSLLGTDALCLTDRDRVLVWDGAGHHHGKDVMEHLRVLLDNGRGTAFDSGCADLDCPLRWAVAVPLTVENRVLGALVAYAPRESAVLARAAGEVARWVCVQLELAELDRSRTQLIEAEIKALRAQISPHFIFNSLAAIASFVRTDPEQARELLLEFADFTRYSFRKHGEFTTLADELHSIDQYLALVRARFGERLAVTLQVAPEVLPVALPFLCLQPLVENAVKHGLEGAVTRSRITISALDAGSEAEVVIEDDGTGMDPERLRQILRGEGGASTGIGLLNVDERLRQVYGDAYGLVIETGIGAGMKITLRLPKYRAGVHGS
ncbi:sensor histidine kinase [Streptomyces griseus]|uniref:Two-component system sensor kinase n=1 Tax=Streptomyces griseus subsp. griseus (strain JCM 4626 / CBS 651.72 / NBRC 13350 / KCC S-0626 / ISP 5235) TaxID=455632 RepID=B1VRY1_STRGG|nr:MULTISPECIES: histidine kinase [Streptomyces]MYR48301.1 sensor histidine kinase [Streptomyces sp. SID4928]EGE40219.1 signal transduction histidine kinase, LytS [Streptomyces sp. ACT-1]SED71262.1 two-component system, LytT family, sensor kinase [Streptomyces griseus]SQA24483.1 Two-component system sensor kinase [Streptomyces griseus]BAG17549.1 putative two-component system sensor kinase [Streptomyces griseus subsp. griseus NBRC 13350]